MTVIQRLTESMLDERVLRRAIYPNLHETYYWDDTWDPALYIEAARAGFISIGRKASGPGPVMLAELQRSYAVLDWKDLHRSTNMRHLMRTNWLAAEGIELRIVGSVELVLERILEQHGRDWLLCPYEDLVLTLPGGDDPRFAIRGVELWSRTREELVAGELGYTIGRTYTSLSGFCSADDKELAGCGTLQMIVLADVLRDAGYAFWNLGHPMPEYKFDLGARDLPRDEFLVRWLDARAEVPTTNLCGWVAQPRSG